MNRRIWPFGIIYLIGAILAFIAVRNEGNEDEQERGSAWKRIPFANIKAISYEGDDLQVTLEPLHETLAWIHYKKGAEGKRFLSNQSEKLKMIWKSLDPIWAQKVIGKKGDLKLEDFGLHEKPASFRIDLKEGGTFDLQVGKRSFLSKSAFALDPGRQEVFLWSLDIIGLLSSAPQNLALLSPLSFADRPLESLTLRVDGRSLTWKSTTSGKWQRDEKTEDLDFAVWFEKLQKVAVDAYPSAEEEQKLPSAPILFDLTIREKGAGGTVYRSSVLSPEGTSYWLKDERFPSLLRLDAQRMNLLKADLEKLKSK